MINHVSIQGRFTRDLELAYSPSSERPYLKFTIAWSEKTKNNAENTCFLNGVAFGNLAKTVAKYFKKGDMTVAEGKLLTNSYKDNNGNKKYSTELIADRIHFCNGKSGSTEEEEDRLPFD